MLRVAFIGAGWSGEVQVRAVQELGRKIEVHSLVDNDQQFLRQQAKKLSVRNTFLDYRTVLEDADVDAVSIGLPHAMHRHVAIEAAEAGKHILCTKPLAPTVAEATEMMDAAARNDVLLYCAEYEPYTDFARHLRQIVHSESSEIGELIFAAVTSGAYAPYWSFPGRRAWLANPAAGGTGIWMLNGTHTAAQVRFILGEVDTVYLTEHHAKSFQGTNVEGTVSGTLTLSAGVPVALVQTAESPLPGNLFGFRLFGDRGSISASRDGYEFYSNEGGSEAAAMRREYPGTTMFPDGPKTHQPSSSGAAVLLDPYARMMESFADNVSGAASGPTTAQNERRTLAVIEAGYESLKTGQPVCLRDRFPGI